MSSWRGASQVALGPEARSLATATALGFQAIVRAKASASGPPQATRPGSPEGVFLQVLGRSPSRPQMLAPHAALGASKEKTGLAEFVHRGLSDETAKAIGRSPEGKGLLGAALKEGKPIRVADISSDPRSTDF